MAWEPLSKARGDRCEFLVASNSTDPRTTWQCLPARTASPMDEAGVWAIAGTSPTWLVLLTGRPLSLSIRCPDHIEALLPHSGNLHLSVLIWFRHWFWEQADHHVPLIFHCSSHKPHIDRRLGSFLPLFLLIVCTLFVKHCFLTCVLHCRGRDLRGNTWSVWES